MFPPSRVARLGVLMLAVPLTVACGDDQRACGEGAELRDGLCVGVGVSQCTDGTILDEATNTCVLDPAACQDGTVMVGGACRDPGADVVVDVVEGAEPNGLGIGGEPSVVPAGQLTLKPARAGELVIKGTLIPRADHDEDGQPEPDFDAYVFSVTSPTLLVVEVDGTNGISGGFLVESRAAELAAWRAVGVNTSGDIARRHVFLPSAGDYALAITDARSVTWGLPVGDATTGYYGSLEVRTVAATALTGGATTGLLEPGATLVFSTSLPPGVHEISLSTPHPIAEGSLTVVVGDAFHGTASERKQEPVVAAAVVTVDAGAGADRVLIAVDMVMATTAAAVPFELVVRPQP